MNRFSGPCQAHVSATVADHFRPVFFTVIDVAYSQLTQRLDPQTMPGLNTYMIHDDGADAFNW